MAYFLGTPKVQYFKTNSVEYLSGGKLYTYASGTTTPKDAYPTIADALADTNPLTNPIILNSRGEATVVLDGEYKLVLKDSDDTEIWTQDNVSDVFPAGVVNSDGKVVQSAILHDQTSFLCYLSSAQTLTTATQTKIVFDTEVYDKGNYVTSANKFTPLIAGRYLIGAQIMFSTWVDNSLGIIYIFKNGNVYAYNRKALASTGVTTLNIQLLVDFNGVDDYVEIYAHQATGSNKDVSGGQEVTYWYGCLQERNNS